MPLSFPTNGIAAEIVGQSFQAADPLSSGSSRPEGRLRARLPAPRFLQIVRSSEN